jgi:hypothetical protein
MIKPFFVKTSDDKTNQNFQEITKIFSQLSVANPVTFTVSGTYKPITDRPALVWIQGGGGGGGGCGGGAGSAAGGGGGSGVCLLLWVSSLGTSVAYSCGSGGAGGNTAGSNGSAGGDTTFTAGGTLYTAKGGGGGTGMTSSTLADAIGGVASAGSSTGLTVVGFNSYVGNRGFVVGGGSFPGAGASSQFGVGANSIAGSFAPGNNATGFGAGGSGGNAGAVGQAGGNGSPGCVKIVLL